LTEATTLPSVIADQIERLRPARIVVVGGRAVISDTVLAALESLYPGEQVHRVAGANRYETSRLISEDAFLEGPADPVAPTPVAFIATGLNFPDALSASAAADKSSAPVILVDGTAGEIDAATQELLQALGVLRVYIAGGTGVVSTGIQSDLLTTFGLGNVSRLAGDDRFSTSVAINSLFGPTVSSAFIANGRGFADALSGAALAGLRNAPLYVTEAECVPATVLGQLDNLVVENLFLLGGTEVLRGGVEFLVPC